jgi:hypothetical protein
MASFPRRRKSSRSISTSAGDSDLQRFPSGLIALGQRYGGDLSPRRVLAYLRKPEGMAKLRMRTKN